MAKKSTTRGSKSSTARYDCTIKLPPTDMNLISARNAVQLNPANAPRQELILSLIASALVPHMTRSGTMDIQGAANDIVSPSFLAVLTTKYWGTKGVDLTVSFMDNPTVALRNKILSYMNRWSECSNVKYSWVQSGGRVRISRDRGGYWSYLGTDIDLIPQDQQTMNLEGFTERTRETEFDRVVVHETGHTNGFPHEHLREKLIELLDVPATIQYFKRTQGWSESQTRANVLTPLDPDSIMASDIADEISIMAYMLPGSITKNGKPIKGGPTLSAIDREFANKIYPKETTPPPPPPEALVVNIPRAGEWIYKGPISAPMSPRNTPVISTLVTVASGTDEDE